MTHFDDHQIFHASIEVLMVLYDVFYEPASKIWLEEENIAKHIPVLDERTIDMAITFLLERNLIHITEFSDLESVKIVPTLVQGFKITPEGIGFIDSNKSF